MRILVAGGAGFLGSHLCDKLLGESNEVVCVDNLFTGNKENISHNLGNSNFEFINHDIIEPYEHNEIDQIYNLACPASPVHYQYDPIKTLKTSVLGSLNLLELTNKNNARILQASTSEVYGDPEQHPQSENYLGNVNPIGPRACYDEGKRCAETLFFDYNRKYNLDIRVVRIFNTYGPRMMPNDGRVVSNFIIQALEQEDITIYGNGLQTRSFCFANDLIDAMILTMNQKDETGPINIGNPTEFTILKLAEKIIEMTGSKSKIIFSDSPVDDPKQRKPDINLAKKTLNWEPTVQLEQGLLKTIKYFEKKLK